MSTSEIQEKLVLFLELNQRAKEEKSAYARLLFQENIIAGFIIATLHAIAFYLNTDTERITLTKERKIILKNKVKVSFDDNSLEEKTLGQLCSVLYPFLAQDDELRRSLQEFIKLRNKITHKMLFEYKHFADLERDSKYAVKVGEGVIKVLNTFRRGLLEIKFT